MSSQVTPEAMYEELKGDLAAILYCEPAEVDGDTPFLDLGLDSILGLEFLAVINGRYALTENIDSVYDHPTLSELTGYLVPRVGAPAADSA